MPGMEGAAEALWQTSANVPMQRRDEDRARNSMVKLLSVHCTGAGVL
jgi:hypothetical protein